MTSAETKPHTPDITPRPDVQRVDLPFTDEVKHATAPILEKIAASSRYREVCDVDAFWQKAAPYIYEINRLKEKHNATVLAHNYMTPDIFFGIADYNGDSLMLAQRAAESDADVIVQCGVHFMAESSKVLSPEKTVLLPNHNAGCSLAEAISANALTAFKREQESKYGHKIPVITYVNTPADVKAASDVCCTSSNATEIVRAIAAETGSKRVIMAPDKHLAANTAQIVKDEGIEIIAWDGACVVHELFTVDDIKRARASGALVVAHPECPKEVIEEVMKDPDTGAVGSTAFINSFVNKKLASRREGEPLRVAAFTECSMSDDLSIATPEAEFLGACHYCPHMRRITISDTYYALRSLEDDFAHERPLFEIQVEERYIDRARKAIDKMIELSAARNVPLKQAC